MARLEMLEAWSEFVQQVNEAQVELAVRPPVRAWYRGVVRESYRLVPSLLRFRNGAEKELSVFEKYREISLRVRPHQEGEWAVLFEMQHYYVPTRLLDWTESLATAVYFATLADSDEKSVLYVLNPILLNKASERDGVVAVQSEKDFGYIDVYVTRGPRRPTKPLAVAPIYTNERIAAQRGRFTVHGSNPEPLDELVPGCCKAIAIKPRDRAMIREHLKMLGVDVFAVFPDIVGAAPFIKEAVGLEG